ncbi:MAG: hypothetical protein IT373_37570 [Polyangiaceae bacterium]|nr:hypothetical protein [Polyangiaceae bacterium]
MSTSAPKLGAVALPLCLGLVGLVATCAPDRACTCDSFYYALPARCETVPHLPNESLFLEVGPPSPSCCLCDLDWRTDACEDVYACLDLSLPPKPAPWLCAPATQQLLDQRCGTHYYLTAGPIAGALDCLCGLDPEIDSCAAFAACFAGG